ncbi:MAG: guanylate kinase [Spirochaetes bacterium]|nr:guanylate kinase [Spirochaetota bacterium]MBN2770909.1 guanylate kinase [Spirochaetota bacterium]
MTVIISAPSGAGKSTIIRELLNVDSSLEFAISSTTRPRRETEQHAREYYFVDSDTFRNEIENEGFLEWAIVHNNYYGTRKKEIDRISGEGKIPVLDIDVQGASILRKKIQDAVFVFIVPPSLEVLEDRLRNRKTDSDEQIGIRLKASILEMRSCAEFDYAVVNDDVTTAVSDIVSIIRSEKLRIERMKQKISDICDNKKL